MPAATTVMLTQTARELPHGDGWAYEPKLDGFRAVLSTAANSATLTSRHGRPLTPYFPEIVAAARPMPSGLLLDGELVIPNGGGVAFVELQNRIHPAGKRVRQLSSQSPAAFIAFDVLTVDDVDVRARNYDQRRALLTQLLTKALPAIGLMPMTIDPVGAGAWLSGRMPGIEGVVAKRRDQRYRPGVRGWYRVRLVNTTEAVVAGITGAIERPDSLILGRPNERGQLRMVGRTGRLATPERNRIGALLHPPVGEHPWPETLPSGRFGQIPGDQVAYVQVAPELVVEVEHDSAAERGRLRHAVKFVRVRPDLEVTDLGPWP